MRGWLIALLLLLGVASPAWSAIAHVQTVSCETGGSTACTTPGVTSTTGNLFVASTGYCCAAFTSITDSKSNTYTNAVAEISFASVLGRQQYVAGGTGGGSHTFTVTGGSGFYASLSVSEISGAAASPLDKTATGTSTSGTSHTTAATATTSQANELLVGFGTTTSDTTFTTDTGAGWTERTNIATDLDTEGLLTGTKIVSATGAYTFTYTTSPRDAVHGISTWKEAAAAAGVRQRCIGCGADGKVIE
jgi:hypothetical protein